MTRAGLMAIGCAGLAVLGTLTGAARPGAARPGADPPASVQDVVYFAKAGPVRGRFHIALGGKPVEPAWQAAADALFAFCDKDGNGALDADERKALAPPRQRPGAQLVLDDEAPTPAGLAVFADRDPPADKATFAAKLRAARLGPVEVVVQPARAGAQPLTDALFRNLDRDRDGKLSAAEVAVAADRLATLDLDEDDLITGPELRGVAVAAAPAPFAVPRLREEPAEDDPPTEDLLALPGGSAAAVKAVMTSRGKDKTGALARSEWGGDATAFAGLDKDGNGRLDPDEVAAWLRRPPDLEVAVGFGGPAAGDGPAHTLGDARVRVTADPGAAAAAADGWKRSADRLRAEFGWLAKDKTAVERKQVEDPNAGGRGLLGVFDFADRNADKALTREELGAAVAAVGAAVACRVEVTILDQGRGLFELIDRSGDGQLSPRELRAAAGLVKELDRDGDGRLDPAEVPRLFPATVAPAAIPVLNVPPPRAAPRAVRAGADGPDWFTKMDRNADGDVSAREFLGPAEVFRKLDRDGDGLLSPDEAKAAK